GKADGIAKDIAGTALDTLKGLKIKRSGSDVRLEVVLNLKSAWKIANKAKKLEEKGGKNAVKKAAGGKAGAISCVSNLKQCGLSFLLYAMDHDGLLPAAAGWQKSVDSAGALKCPACGKEYRYLGDSGINADELANADKCVFVYCEFEHEKGKLQACFADGHVASVDKAQLEAAVKSRAAGSLPVVK
ncbi:MAG: hypothetical protein IKT16_08545, partial [Desulfovibrio sp.]|nr:hypothetical protein [Desulfovibrio sp.]